MPTAKLPARFLILGDVQRTATSFAYGVGQHAVNFTLGHSRSPMLLQQLNERQHQLVLGSPRQRAPDVARSRDPEYELIERERERLFQSIKECSGQLNFTT